MNVILRRLRDMLVNERRDRDWIHGIDKSGVASVSYMNRLVSHLVVLMDRLNIIIIFIESVDYYDYSVLYFRIIAVQQHDSGSYICIARSSEGILVSADLTVLGMNIGSFIPTKTCQRWRLDMILQSSVAQDPSNLSERTVGLKWHLRQKAPIVSLRNLEHLQYLENDS